MIRTIMLPENRQISISLPKQFAGKKVEVIAFSIDEAETENIVDKTGTHFAGEKI